MVAGLAKISTFVATFAGLVRTLADRSDGLEGIDLVVRLLLAVAVPPAILTAVLAGLNSSGV